MLRKSSIAPFLALVVAGACTSTIEPDPNPNPDMMMPMDPPMLPPPVLPNEAVTVSGSIRGLDAYLRGENVYLAGATVNPLGTVGLAPAIADAQGAFALEVPQNGKIIFEIEKGLHVTTYEELSIADRPINGKSFFLAPAPWVSQIAVSYDVNIADSFNCHAPNPTTDKCRFGIVIGRLVDDGTAANGTPTPVAGVSADDVTVEQTYKKGPYFLSSIGEPNATYTTSQDGGLFVLFLEVPELGPADSSFQVHVASNDGVVNRYFGPQVVKAIRDGLTWVTIAETGREQLPPPVYEQVDFDTQIYPLFLPINLGGLGCQGCHTSAGGAIPEAGMDLSNGPEAAYRAIDPTNYPGRVRLDNPPASLLLVRPLYEANGVQDHPIYAFVEQDPSYQVMLSWIREGGKRDMPVETPVSFYNEVRPLLYQPSATGGAGCYACHVDRVNKNNAPGELYFGGDGNELHQRLTAEAPADNGNTTEPYRINKTGVTAASLLLTNPLSGSIEPHPVKIFSGVDDPRYQLIYRWISQGYVNDTPPR